MEDYGDAMKAVMEDSGEVLDSMEEESGEVMEEIVEDRYCEDWEMAPDAQLKKRLNKIMALDYFITTPAMKGPVEVAAAAAAGNYAHFQVPGVSTSVPVQMESFGVQYQPENELEAENTAEVVSDHQEYVKAPSEFGNNERDVEYQEQQYGPRRSYQNQRGGRTACSFFYTLGIAGKVVSFIQLLGSEAIPRDSFPIQGRESIALSLICID